MDTAEEYLSKTKSAAKTIFEGIDNYQKILRKLTPMRFISGYQDDQKYKEWRERNKMEIAERERNQAQYIDEIFAQSVLCGSIIQIAAMAINKYSTNKKIPFKLKKFKKIEVAKKYCIGRTIREVPIGLLIYASRNQYNHLNQTNLWEPSRSIFQKIATIKPSKYNNEEYIDPAFNLKNPSLINYASNITALMEWRSYENYEADMNFMLNAS